MRGSVVTFLPSGQEATCSIPGSVVGFLYSEELFNGMFGLGVSVFQSPMAILVLLFLLVLFVCLLSLKETFILLTTGHWRPPIDSVFLYGVHRNFNILRL